MTLKMSSDSSSVPQYKTYFHMHYVSMQPNKKKASAIATAFAGTLSHCIRESQHLQTAFSLHKYLCN